MIRTLTILLLAMPAFADEGLLACRDIKDAAERVACYDRLVDGRFPREAEYRLGTIVSQPPQSDAQQTGNRSSATTQEVTSQEATVQEATAQKSAQEPVPQPGGGVVQTPILQPANEAVDQFGKPKQAVSPRTEITATITELTKSAHRKLTITLDNHQTWRQLDSKTMLLSAGDKITIRAASFDSYLLRKSSGGKSIRVKRLN